MREWLTNKRSSERRGQHTRRGILFLTLRRFARENDDAVRSLSRLVVDRRVVQSGEHHQREGRRAGLAACARTKGQTRGKTTCKLVRELIPTTASTAQASFTPEKARYASADSDANGKPTVLLERDVRRLVAAEWYVEEVTCDRGHNDEANNENGQKI